MLDAILEKSRGELASPSRMRRRVDVQRLPHGRLKHEGKTYISFSCNDYLGLSFHPRVVEAAAKALQAYGTGAGASRLVTGNHPLYAEFERAMAAYKGAEDCLVFGSGYLANIGVITALAGEGDIIFADKLVHACMIDGSRLSGAKLVRFAHNSTVHLQALLQKYRKHAKRCLILSETVFSMDGDCAPIDELARIAERNLATLVLDDAHGLGVIQQALPSHTILTGTCSKALGSYGGYVCASQSMIDFFVNHARSVIFSTGLPPATVAASLAALEIMQHENMSGEVLKKAQTFTSRLGLPEAQSAIVPLIIGGDAEALKASDMLKAEGFWVTAIRPPTVPENTARLRFAFSAAHSDADVEALIRAVRERLGAFLPCVS